MTGAGPGPQQDTPTYTIGVEFRLKDVEVGGVAARLALYCTVLYCTVLYCTVLYCTLLYCTGEQC